MQIKTYDALRNDMKRGARAIARTNISTRDFAACWHELCHHGIDINGYPVKASWVFDDIIARVKAIRSACSIEATA